MHRAEVNSCINAPFETWYHRFRHICENKTRELITLYDLPLSNKKPFCCKTCVISKMHHLPYSSIHIVSSSPLDLIYPDVWGPTPRSSANGAWYYILFVDDRTKYNWFFPMKFKSNVKQIFVDFKNSIKKSSSRFIKALKRTMEANSWVLILHWCACPHAHQQMGAVKHRHHHGVDNNLALLNHVRLPHSFWRFVFATGMFIYNRTTMVTSNIPYEKFF